jgi:hypothetical protein
LIWKSIPCGPSWSRLLEYLKRQAGYSKLPYVVKVSKLYVSQLKLKESVAVVTIVKVFAALMEG